MRTMRCLAIGISDAPPLDYLPGAVNGAKAFAAWATAQGCTTQLLTDERTPVGFDEVRQALLQLLEGPDQIFRLFVYFAGHGLARDAAEDLWLLSRWQEDQRAVAVNGLRRKLNRYGLAQVTIIGDACRSLPVDEDSADLTPDPVLGKGPYDATEASVDLLRASASFHAAYMVPGARIEDYRCIFSGVLAEALSGAFEDAFDKGRDAVTSFSLADFLKKAVPARAEKYNVVLKPSVVPGFAPPENVYLAARPARPPVATPWPVVSAVPVGQMGPGAGPNTIFGHRGWSAPAPTVPSPASPSPAPRPSPPPPIADPADVASAPPSPPRPRTTLESLASKIAAAFPLSSFMRAGRFSSTSDSSPAGSMGAAMDSGNYVPSPIGGIDFTAPPMSAAATIARKTAAFQKDYLAEDDRPTQSETNAGLTLSGGTATTVLLGRHARAFDDLEQRWWRIAPADAGASVFWRDGILDQPLPAAVELASGNWTVAAALPGYIGTFTIVDGGVASLIYRPIASPEMGRETEAAVARMRAGGLTPEDAFDLAATFRETKTQDPVRAVLAAYLYDSQADTESVLRTAYWLADFKIPIPFDVILLGQIPCHRDESGLIIASIRATRGRGPRSDKEAELRVNCDDTPAITGYVAGIFPWLRQGWDLLEPDLAAPVGDDDLRALRRLLLPHPFTTLKPESGPRLRKIMERF